MIIRKDIEQGSEQWHELKHGKIGGSRAKQLFVNTDSLLIELLAEKCEEFEPKDNFQTSDMQRGNELEPEARKYLNDYLGVEFLEVGWLQHSTIDILGISPDGITKDNKISCEIKCFGAKKHTEVLRENEIPKEYLAQCLHYFLVNESLEKHYFISYRPENLYKVAFIKELNRDSIVDIGTNAKPKLMSVTEAIELMKQKAIEIQLNVNKEIELLQF